MAPPVVITDDSAESTHRLPESPDPSGAGGLYFWLVFCHVECSLISSASSGDSLGNKIHPLTFEHLGKRNYLAHLFRMH